MKDSHIYYPGLGWWWKWVIGIFIVALGLSMLIVGITNAEENTFTIVPGMLKLTNEQLKKLQADTMEATGGSLRVTLIDDPCLDKYERVTRAVDWWIGELNDPNKTVAYAIPQEIKLDWDIVKLVCWK